MWKLWIHLQSRPVHTWSGCDPHWSHSSIHFMWNWINPLHACLHYKLNKLVQGPYMVLWWHTCHLLVHNFFWISHPAGFGCCLLLMHTTLCWFLVHSNMDSLMSSTNMCFRFQIQSTYHTWIGPIQVWSIFEKTPFHVRAGPVKRTETR